MIYFISNGPAYCKTPPNNVQTIALMKITNSLDL